MFLHRWEQIILFVAAGRRGELFGAILKLLGYNPFSLAIVKDGKNMIGEKLFVMSPLKNKVIPVEIVSSHYVDPKGERVRS